MKDDRVKDGISVIVIARNEERNILECLRSVSWADEIIVVDTGSTDRTREIAGTIPGTFVLEAEWMGFGPTKNYAIEHAAYSWIFWIDADERASDELGREAQAVVAAKQDRAGYRVARRAFFLGKWIKHCGWYPGYVVRLFRKDSARFDDSPVHEKLIVSGIPGTLKHDLYHYTDDTIFHYMTKFNRYTSLAAEGLTNRGGTYRLLDLITRPPFMFFKMYFLKLGVLDGAHGFVLSLLSSAYVFTKYVKIWDITRQRDNQSQL